MWMSEADIHSSWVVSDCSSYTDLVALSRNSLDAPAQPPGTEHALVGLRDLEKVVLSLSTHFVSVSTHIERARQSGATSDFEPRAAARSTTGHAQHRTHVYRREMQLAEFVASRRGGAKRRNDQK